ncbi:MAG: NAD(P)H-dependent oxidoreductase [Candidatus Diapherotrites archaeon]|nr:NAD(P)H-dependent oxidoreductase [Candidatus Diapherotrites archaeon]
MKTLIAYYSKSGANEAAAKELQKILNADLEKITDLNSRKGILGFLSGGSDASKKKNAKIAPWKKDPAGYGAVVLMSPLWAGLITPALRTYIDHNRERFKKIAFLSVSGGGAKNEQALPDLESFAGKKTIASLLLSGQEAKEKTMEEKLLEFAKKIK